LRDEESVQVGLLFGRLAEDEYNGRQGYGCVQRAEIVFGLRHGVNLTGHAGAVRVLDRTFDKAGLGREHAGEDTGDEKVLSDDSMHIGGPN
jgi:hypothetical protein